LVYLFAAAILGKVSASFGHDGELMFYWQSGGGQNNVKNFFSKIQVGKTFAKATSVGSQQTKK
jgi:hypothetical protein